MLEIREAHFPEDRDEVVHLFRAYAASLSVDLCFQGFEAEVAGLPGAYAPPGGRLLVACEDGKAIGCGALRPAGEATAEMKRLYVEPRGRGKRVGEKLAAAIIAAAREIGYRRLCLDTLPEMGVAQKLYRKLGFVDIAPYYANPIPGARFLGLDLTS